MRIYNIETFQQNLKDVAFSLAPGFVHYSRWLGESVSKWLLKNDREFRNTFLSSVTQRTSSLMEGMPARYYAKVNGVETRLYFDDLFDQKDIAAGTLFYYTDVGLRHWLLRKYPVLVDARDFFLEKVQANLAFDLRRYTLDTLARSVRDWHVERQRILAWEARNRLAEHRGSPASKSNFLVMLDVSRALVAAPIEREKSLDEAWSLLVEGVDYKVFGSVLDCEVLQYLSTSGLEWESAFKLNCINGSHYKSKLSDPSSMLLSVREKGLRSRSLYTVECQFYREWGVVQFERWGYAHPKYNIPDSTSDRRSLLQALEELLKPVKRPDRQLVREISRGYNEI